MLSNMERFCSLKSTFPNRRWRRIHGSFTINFVCVAIACAFALGIPVIAQNNAPIAPSSMPSLITVLGDSIVFVADDGIHGSELWVSDGEPGNAHLLKDIWPGSVGSNPSQLYVVGAHLYFAADTPADIAATNSKGAELWVTDGTSEGTRLVSDIRPGRLSSDIFWMADDGSIAYFEANDGTHGGELWRTDGTDEGTYLVKDIFQGQPDSKPAKSGAIVLPDGRLVSAAYVDGNFGLFVSDGTSEGTSQIAQVHDGASMQIVFEGLAYFSASDEAHGGELWCTDGTSEGTRLLLDIAPGPEGSGASRLCEFGGCVLFKASDGKHGAELWRSDGTKEGTVLVKDLNPGLHDSDPYSFTPAGRYVYFVAVAPQMGREIWRTDGTAEGTILLKDIYPGPVESVPYSLCPLGDTLIFTAMDPEFGEELWRSDGTPESTRLVKDIYPGAIGNVPVSGYPDKTIAFKGKVYFRATTETTGCELWRSDGTEAGTQIVDDVWDSIVSNPSSSPRFLTSMNDTLYFVATDFEHGNELFRVGPDAVGAELVKDIFPGVASSDPHDLTPVNGLLYFGADDGTNGDELWRSDGTTEGTAPVADYAQGRLSSHPNQIVTCAGTTYFVAWRPEDGTEVRGLVGGGIKRIRDIAPGAISSNPRELVAVGNLLFFRADDGSHGEELWVSEGDEVNTRMVYDLLPKAAFGAVPKWLTPVNSMLFFAANDGLRGDELWCIDASLRPQLVADVAVPRTLVRKVPSTVNTVELTK